MPCAKPTFHLAAVDGGIDGTAEVVDDLHLVDGIGAAQAVDGDLEHGGAVHVVGERVTALALLIVVDAGRDVVAVRGQPPAGVVGEADQVRSSSCPAGLSGGVHLFAGDGHRQHRFGHPKLRGGHLRACPREWFRRR